VERGGWGSCIERLRVRGGRRIGVGERARWRWVRGLVLGHWIC
jgi:hypothetical protein